MQPLQAPLGVNVLLLAVVLVPGYLVLRGYLDATVQLDTMSRLDKLLLTVLGGTLTVAALLAANRLGVFAWVVSLSGEQAVSPGEHLGRAVTLAEIQNVSGRTLVSFVLGQSGVGYLGGYLYGTVRQLRSRRPQRTAADAQQPWETAVRHVSYGSPVRVVTRDGARLSGRIDRVGSPSESADFLLWDARRERVGGDSEQLGVVYVSHRSVSRVQLDLEPQGRGREGNWLVRRLSRQ